MPLGLRASARKCPFILFRADKSPRRPVNRSRSPKGEDNGLLVGVVNYPLTDRKRNQVDNLAALPPGS